MPAPPALRTRAFEFRSADSVTDGRTLEGYAAVFNQTIRVSGVWNEWDERIIPGAFVRSLAERTPVVQFEHGKDPRTGTVPIAAISDIHEDPRGLYVRAKLFDNPIVEPIRQAIEAGAITGMSFRFKVEDEDVQRRQGDVELRSITAVALRELGPVVFPAYDQTKVHVRSVLAGLDADEHRALLDELARELAECGIPQLTANATVTTGGSATFDFTGRPDARSAGGGDQRPSAAPSSSARARDRALKVMGVLNG